jgi:hypothetical protein
MNDLEPQVFAETIAAFTMNDETNENATIDDPHIQSIENMDPHGWLDIVPLV